jgi:hypothetical protein
MSIVNDGDKSTRIEKNITKEKDDKNHHSPTQPYKIVLIIICILEVNVYLHEQLHKVMIEKWKRAYTFYRRCPKCSFR